MASRKRLQQFIANTSYYNILLVIKYKLQKIMNVNCLA